jgi:hypothetical protein
MPAVRAAGSAWQGDNNQRAVSVPIGRADDVAAALEAAGHSVEVLFIGATPMIAGRADEADASPMPPSSDAAR